MDKIKGKEVLLNIGSIVDVEHDSVMSRYLITGRRVINHVTRKAWDYHSTPYPEGSYLNKDGCDSNGFYFNHPDIDNIFHVCTVLSLEESEELEDNLQQEVKRQRPLHDQDTEREV